MSARPGSAARGFTLIEVTIVTMLAALVVLGLLGFYMNSQAIWLDGSSQAMAQRDGTLLLETLSDSVRVSARALIFDSPDSLHQGVVLFDSDGNERGRFWWDAQDSLVHLGPGQGRDAGPVVGSRVRRFQLDALTGLVEIRLIELSAGQGQAVRTSSAAGLYNRPTPAGP
jgi:type II secretory pathway pseudopilin PulG